MASTLNYLDSDIQHNTQFVLCIEELDYIYNDPNSKDNVIYVYYDIKDSSYVVRGKRQNFDSKQYAPYTYWCKTSTALLNFIKFIVGANKINISLYNFNNMNDMTFYETTYEFFEEMSDESYIVSAYDYCLADGEELSLGVSLLA